MCGTIFRYKKNVVIGHIKNRKFILCQHAYSAIETSWLLCGSRLFSTLAQNRKFYYPPNFHQPIAMSGTIFVSSIYSNVGLQIHTFHFVSSNHDFHTNNKLLGTFYIMFLFFYPICIQYGSSLLLTHCLRIHVYRDSSVCYLLIIKILILPQTILISLPQIFQVLISNFSLVR